MILILLIILIKFYKHLMVIWFFKLMVHNMVWYIIINIGINLILNIKGNIFLS